MKEWCKTGSKMWRSVFEQLHYILWVEIYDQGLIVVILSITEAVKDQAVRGHREREVIVQV